MNLTPMKYLTNFARGILGAPLVILLGEGSFSNFLNKYWECFNFRFFPSILQPKICVKTTFKNY